MKMVKWLEGKQHRSVSPFNC